MKGRVIVLDHVAGREAAALVVDGRLEDLRIEPGADAPPRVGAIFRGRADRPMKGQGGVFVALPEGMTGFLRNPGGVAAGKPLLVQVSGTAEPGKAVPLSTRLLFKTRLAILTPGAPGLNISRRIRDEDRRGELDRLTRAAMANAAPDLGMILRSAAETADDDEIAEELSALRELAEAVLADTEGAPELLLDDAGPHDLAWRDWTDPAPDDVAEGPGSLAAHDVLDMIDAVLNPEVALAGGGTMLIEPTRALIAVDVNTGADASPGAGLKANIAAARELPRQLRLRGLGGQVTVDFAPMPKRDRHVLEQVLRAAFKGEASETSLAGWTPLGLYEIQRKRDRLALTRCLAPGDLE
ncbi:MAG: ribonuclease E/G [Paracoccaceae bacterium]